MLGRSEAELEAMLLQQIAEVKRQYPDVWSNPELLAEKLGIRMVTGNLGNERQGVALPGLIVVGAESARRERWLFTAYHELVHHILRQNDELWSYLHDLCSSDDDLEYCVERFCDSGAAEFLVERAIIRDAIRRDGFSIELVRSLRARSSASLTAICIQLVHCAAHRCAAVVCHLSRQSDDLPMGLREAGRPAVALAIGMATTSPGMKYRPARGTLIPHDHLLAEAYESAGELVRGTAALPFRYNRTWVVACEAVRLGEQVFGLFNIDSPPKTHRDQLPLF